MPNVTARYWGVRGARSNITIGEVELFEVTIGDVGEMIQATFPTSLYSSSITETRLDSEMILSMDGNLETTQSITFSDGRYFGIALDCEEQVAIRCIAVRNAPDVGADFFVPFAVDSSRYFVDLGYVEAPTKIQRYSTLKTEEIDGSFNYYYTILPVVETDNPSIARGSLTKPKIGAC